VEARMLRISVEGLSNRHETLHLEGHLVGPWVAQLQLSCEQVLGESKRLTLDLTAVSFRSPQSEPSRSQDAALARSAAASRRVEQVLQEDRRICRRRQKYLSSVE